MLQWNEMHPYSAVHVLQIAGVLDTARLRTSINRTVERHGLTRLTLDRERFTYRYDGGTADCALQTISGNEGPRRALVTEIERQLNLGFAHRRPFSPFRFLVAPAGDSFFLGLVYFHPVADAESVVGLLQDIVVVYLDQARQGSGGPLELYPDSQGPWWLRHPRVVARKLLALPRQIHCLRRSCRAHYRDPGDMTNGFDCFSVPPEGLHTLMAAAESWSVTVNDLLLTLLLRCLAPCVARRARKRRRDKISVGCIVNLRKDLGLDQRRVFGVFLGSFTVTHEVRRGISLRQLAEDIRQQTSRIKRDKLYLGTPLELGLARCLIRFFAPRRGNRFHAKHYPLWGGLTNMNLNPLWQRGSSSAPLDYFRGVATGPVTPLVLSATTTGNRMSVGLSYRLTVFSRPDIEELQQSFQRHLEEARRDL